MAMAKASYWVTSLTWILLWILNKKSVLKSAKCVEFSNYNCPTYIVCLMYGVRKGLAMPWEKLPMAYHDRDRLVVCCLKFLVCHSHSIVKTLRVSFNWNWRFVLSRATTLRSSHPRCSNEVHHILSRQEVHQVSYALSFYRGWTHIISDKFLSIGPDRGT